MRRSSTLVGLRFPVKVLGNKNPNYSHSVDGGGHHHGSLECHCYYRGGIDGGEGTVHRRVCSPNSLSASGRCPSSRGKRLCSRAGQIHAAFVHPCFFSYFLPTLDALAS